MSPVDPPSGAHGGFAPRGAMRHGLDEVKVLRASRVQPLVGTDGNADLVATGGTEAASALPAPPPGPASVLTAGADR